MVGGVCNVSHKLIILSCIMHSMLVYCKCVKNKKVD